MDFSKVLYGPVYRTQGVPATVTLADTDVAIPLTMKDLTAGLQIGGPLDLETMRPAASARAVDLVSAGLDVNLMDQAVVVINSVSWTINAWRQIPTPNGTGDGEVIFLLEGSSEE